MSLFDLTGTVRRLSTNTYTVTRLGEGSIVAGRYVDGASSTFEIIASIQPTNGRDLLRLPEGLRTKQLLSVWTDTPLRTADAPSGPKADVITYQGRQFQVETVLDWAESGEYNKVIVSKVGQ
jgi:hypothetical protein